MMVAARLPIEVRERAEATRALRSKLAVEHATSNAFHSVFSAMTQAWRDRELHSSTAALLGDFARQHGHQRVLQEAQKVVENPSLLTSFAKKEVTQAEAVKATVRSLAALGDHRYFHFIVEHGLKHRDPSVRVVALTALKQIGAPAERVRAYVKELTLPTNEPNPAVRRVALQAHTSILREWAASKQRRR